MMSAIEHSPHSLASRILRFLQKPAHEQSRSLYVRWRRVFPSVPLPIRLPFGVWWVARNDYLGSTLSYDGFDLAERAFIQRFVRPGMTILDIGAHHGFYTLLLSKCVGPTGRVLAFEPSPRERHALRLNLRLNRAHNVLVHSAALGEAPGECQLHLANGSQTGCNSLRRSKLVPADTSVPVQIKVLDRLLAECSVDRVDFIKLDVEGAELSILKGAQDLLRAVRPVILAEVEDRRTEPWGYPARDIVVTLDQLDYRWFSLQAGGLITEISSERDKFEANLVAIPIERKSEVFARLAISC